MPDLAIGAAIASLKAAGDLAGTFLKVRDLAQVQGKVIELQSVILAAQQNALAAQSEQFMLLDEKRLLEKKVADLEAWQREKDRYALTEVGARVFAYVLKPSAKGEEPDHWICARCYQHGKKSILQSGGAPGKYGGDEHFKCFECNSTFGVHYDGQPFPRSYRGSGGEGSWMG